MSDSFQDIERQARALPADDRARLIELLLESLRDTPLTDIEAQWDTEIEARVAAFGRGDLETRLAEDVFAEARRANR